jgi:tryptophan synthase alpha chain
MTEQTGLGAIEAAFAKAKSEGRAAFMPYFTLGYPDMETSLAAIEALATAGADVIELGVPFSDPVADGPVVQHSSQVSLDSGTRVIDCIAAVKTLRDRGIRAPFVLMGYMNPLMAYGLDKYAADAAAAGANGFIVPDLPPEEAGELAAACDRNGLALIPLLAPTSTPQRIGQVAEHARGFIYLVSVTGVTGARDNLAPDLEAYTARVRAITNLPLAFGFGISKPDQVKFYTHLADGIIVGSALVRLMENGGIPAIRKLAEDLRTAC